jgi:hypothetical protein
MKSVHRPVQTGSLSKPVCASSLKGYSCLIEEKIKHPHNDRILSLAALFSEIPFVQQMGTFQMNFA